MALDRKWVYTLLAVVAVRGVNVALMPFNALNDAEYHLALATSIAQSGFTPFAVPDITLFHVLAAPFSSAPRAFVALFNLFFVCACFFLVKSTSRSRLHFLLLALNPLALIYGASFYADLLTVSFVALALAFERLNHLAASGLGFLAAFSTRINGLLPAFPILAERTHRFHWFFWPFVALVTVAYTLYSKAFGVERVFEPNPVNFGLALLFLLPLLRLPPKLAWERGLFLLAFSLQMIIMSASVQARYLLPFLPLLFDGLDFRRERKTGLAYLGLGLLVAVAFLFHFMTKYGEVA